MGSSIKTDPTKSPSRLDDEPNDTVEAEARSALDRLGVEARKLVLEMQRFLSQQEQH